jgi:hypothetical protein
VLLNKFYSFFRTKGKKKGKAAKNADTPTDK